MRLSACSFSTPPQSNQSQCGNLVTAIPKKGKNRTVIPTPEGIRPQIPSDPVPRKSFSSQPDNREQLLLKRKSVYQFLNNVGKAHTEDRTHNILPPINVPQPCHT
ncbi:hypothetical protein AVEN_155049-1 [Araneus ventricosus]|uniref:Uncharacterized protein n=1 Tax=Araneus ventricosus TaxID=182803 RepID=A0A4Y2A7L2_ARAVE|nr:hypothetical protein AVEN_155049-1 [Araneus ventricosus]